VFQQMEMDPAAQTETLAASYTDPAKTGVILTGGDFQALGILRSLARKNIPVLILESDHCISRYSVCKKRIIKSPPPSHHADYAHFLMTLADKEHVEGWTIFPNSDESVYVLSRYRNMLQRHYRIPTPGWDVIQHVYIKKNTYTLAEKNGIPIPRTFFPGGLDELAELKLDYPVVLKPSIRDHYYSQVKTKAYRINNRTELLETYRKICSVIPASEVLVQDMIPGGPSRLYSFCPFFKDGKVLASITARRSRQHPMDFGHASTFAETADIPELQTLAERFLGLIGYYGIAEVEFMLDPRDNRFKLIEVNPRFWGWHSLAIAAGVDLPHYLFQDMTGQKPVFRKSDPNVKWLHLTTDIPTVFLEILRGRMTMGDYMASLRGRKQDAVFALDDPLPFIAELCMIPYLWVKRGF
jgi:D-aspartate ligase